MIAAIPSFALQLAGYNEICQAQERSVAQTLLDTLHVHHADSFGWALACCGWQRWLAEDVLQESYLRVLDGRARFGGRASRRTWFFGVIRHVAAEQRRGQARRAVLGLRLARDGADNGDAGHAGEDAHGDSLYRDQSAQRLQAALLQLAERQREVLHLVFYAELTLEEAAVVLRVSTGTARTHYHRGKERLAALLASADGPEPSGEAGAEQRATRSTEPGTGENGNAQ